MSKSEGAEWINDFERNLGIPSGSLDIDRPTGKPFQFHIPCDGGRGGQPHKAILECSNMPNPDRMRRIVGAKGWRTNGRHITCPDCVQAERTRKSLPKPPAQSFGDQIRDAVAPLKLPVKQRARASAPSIIEAPQETKPMATAANDTQPQPTKDGRAMRRAIVEWLDQAYDTDAGRYRPGFSDNSIANEAKAPEPLVKKIREEFYGEAGEPPELQAAREEITAAGEALERANAAIQQKVGELQGQITTLTRDAENNRTKCEQIVRDALAKVEAAAKANGWAV